MNPGSYPVWSGDHVFRCATAHEHDLGRCCAPECWCRQEPLQVLALASGGPGPDEASSLAHAPHPLCRVSGWHRRADCRALLNAAGEFRPVKVAR